MTAVAPVSTSAALDEVTASYVAAASSSASAKGRRLAAQRFGRLFEVRDCFRTRDPHE